MNLTSPIGDLANCNILASYDSHHNAIAYDTSLPPTSPLTLPPTSPLTLPLTSPPTLPPTLPPTCHQPCHQPCHRPHRQRHINRHRHRHHYRPPHRHSPRNCQYRALVLALSTSTATATTISSRYGLPCHFSGWLLRHLVIFVVLSMSAAVSMLSASLPLIWVAASLFASLSVVSIIICGLHSIVVVCVDICVVVCRSSSALLSAALPSSLLLGCGGESASSCVFFGGEDGVISPQQGRQWQEHTATSSAILTNSTEEGRMP